MNCSTGSSYVPPSQRRSTPLTAASLAALDSTSGRQVNVKAKRQPRPISISSGSTVRGQTTGSHAGNVLPLAPHAATGANATRINNVRSRRNAPVHLSARFPVRVIRPPPTGPPIRHAILDAAVQIAPNQRPQTPSSASSDEGDWLLAEPDFNLLTSGCQCHGVARKRRRLGTGGVELGGPPSGAPVNPPANIPRPLNSHEHWQAVLRALGHQQALPGQQAPERPPANIPRPLTPHELQLRALGYQQALRGPLPPAVQAGDEARARNNLDGDINRARKRRFEELDDEIDEERRNRLRKLDDEIRRETNMARITIERDRQDALARMKPEVEQRFRDELTAAERVRAVERINGERRMRAAMNAQTVRRAARNVARPLPNDRVSGHRRRSADERTSHTPISGSAHHYSSRARTAIASHNSDDLTDVARTQGRRAGAGDVRLDIYEDLIQSIEDAPEPEDDDATVLVVPESDHGSLDWAFGLYDDDEAGLESEEEEEEL